jgi:hypothetical protein
MTATVFLDMITMMTFILVLTVMDDAGLTAHRHSSVYRTDHSHDDGGSLRGHHHEDDDNHLSNPHHNDIDGLLIMMMVVTVSIFML